MILYPDTEAPPRLILEVDVPCPGGPPSTPSGITISPGSMSLAPGATQQFTANVPVIWTASSGSIDVTGLFTAPNVTAATVVTITARSTANSSQFSIVNVSIQPTTPPPITVAISPGSVTLNPAQTQQFTAVVTGSTNQTVVWSLVPGVGTITAGGLYTAPATVASATTVTVSAVAAADLNASAHTVVMLNPSVGPPPTQLDLLAWLTLSTRTTQHLAGDPSAPYEVQWLDTDAGYPANYPRSGVGWFVKNKLGNPWDVFRYDANYALSHWITENGDSQYQAQCQAANGTTCWLYARAYKRNTTVGGIHILPRHFTPGTTITIDNPAPNNVVRTADCEATTTTINLGPVRSITTGLHKISWGGSIDKGAGTLATAPNYDPVNGVNTIKNQYMFSGSFAGGFADVEETYYVLGFGRVAWYYYHAGAFVQKTVNTTLASGGHPVLNFPCGVGKPWFV